MLKMYVKMKNYKDSVIENISNRMINEDGGEAGSNILLGVGISVIITGLIIASAKDWFPVAFTKISAKALEILGIS